MKQPSINIAILGFGVVGSGTAQVLARSIARTNHRNQSHINLKYILVRKDLPDHPYYDKMVQDFAQIEADPTVDIVVESIGGLGAAYDLTKRALTAGKSVVTPNKELVATHGAELLALAKENNCNYLFESAVGGGIPVLRPLTTCLLGNKITEVAGILNGTTNFILSQMGGTSPKTYEEALKEAQDLGYAEQDPTADVEGHDACRKLAILGNIAFGGVMDPHSIPTQGITGIKSQDTQAMTALSASIKLVGRTFQNDQGDIFAYVSPHVVSPKSPFYGVADAFNIIQAQCDSLGTTHFYGQGAGPLPTASAVVGDIIDLAKDHHRFRHNGWDSTPLVLGDINQVKQDYYLRFHATTAQIKEASKTLSFQFASSEDQSPTAIVLRNMSKAEILSHYADLELANIFPLLAD